MTSFSTKLFLGYPQSDSFMKALRAADQQLINMFIQEGSEYLQTVDQHEISYVGKWIGPITDMKTLTLMELNIYSLLQRLTPDYPVTQTPLKLLSIRS